MKLEKLTSIQLKRLKIAGYVTLAIVSASAYAYPAESYDFEYYSDATFTEQVGEKSLNCNGRLYKWGIETPYKIGTTHKCEFYGGLPPEGLPFVP